MPTKYQYFPLGGTRALRLTPDLAIIEDNLNVRRFVVLTFSRFNVIIYRMNDIDEAIQQNIRNDFHLGGGFYLEIFNHQKMIDIRQWYYDDGENKPTKKGITLRFSQWERLKEAMNQLNERRPDIASVVPCSQMEEHFYNQLGFDFIVCFTAHQQLRSLGPPPFDVDVVLTSYPGRACVKCMKKMCVDH